jgi:phosphotransferase system HPr (HPr) family protein
VKLASTFKSNIILVHDNKEINVKDIWEVLNGGVDSGDEISIKCDGEDENVAIEQIATFISNEEVS